MRKTMRRVGSWMVCSALIGLGCDADPKVDAGPKGNNADSGAGADSGADVSSPGIDSGVSMPSGDGGTGVHDGGTVPPTASDVLCGARPGGSLYGDHVVRFENAEQEVVVQIERTYEGPAAGESVLLGLAAFGLRVGDETHCSAGSDPLSYSNSHHNWNDTARAQIRGTRYTLDIVFSLDELEWIPLLTGYDSSDETVLGPLSLIPTGGPTNCFSCPNHTPLFISEVMTHNTETLVDETDEHPPWVEICNPSGDDVYLEGWWLSNDLLDREQWALPAMNLERHQCIVVFADGVTDKGALHASFELSADGGELVLTDPRGVTDAGFVFGRLGPDMSLVWSWTDRGYVASSEPTPGVPDWDD